MEAQPVIRFRYRPKAVQPELINGKEGVSLSLQKKVKFVEEDPYGEVKVNKWEEPIFLANHTQTKRIEKMYNSDEEALRKKQYPTVYERILTQKEWAREQYMEAKLASERAFLMREADLLIQQAKHPSAEVDQLLEELRIQQEEDEEDQEMMQMSKEKGQADHHEEQLLEIKERKLVGTRDTEQFHKELTKWDKKKRAFKMYLGFSGVPKKQDMSLIFPWLILGRREIASNQQKLLQLNVTHILNMTHDVPCMFPAYFVYEQVQIKDSIESNLIPHFQKIVTFIQRAYNCKGRILVHCTAGASRAPTAVIAYLIKQWGCSLVDAFTYVQLIRPIIQPNKSFLYQLAMFEVEIGQGCSVYYHKDWRFYEFNVFRAQQVEERTPEGVYKTAMKLLGQQETEDDDLENEEEGRDNEERKSSRISISSNNGNRLSVGRSGKI